MEDNTIKDKMKRLSDNIITQANKKRYAEATDEQRKKIDALKNSYESNTSRPDALHINDIQLRVLKRKRKYPEIGDIFRLMPPNNTYLYGIVINNHVKGIGITEAIVVMIFETKEKLLEACGRTISPDDLFIPPLILTKLYWTKGYFETIDRIEDFHCDADYGFYRAFEDVFVTENDIPIDHRPQIFDSAGICTYIGVASIVYREMVYRNMI